MVDQLLSFAAQFETLARNLAALKDLHPPGAAAHTRLERAQSAARRAAALVRAHVAEMDVPPASEAS